MTRNPLWNAILAAGYIVLVASLMYYGPHFVNSHEPSVLIPVAILSLFTLSAAVMGYLFLYEPLQMYLEGNKTEAVALFLKTVGAFAAITAGFLILQFTVIR